MNTDNTHRAVCPYCGHEHESSWEWEDGEHECSQCGLTFQMETYIERIYSTVKMDTCPICGVLVAVNVGKELLAIHSRTENRERIRCNGSRGPGNPQPERATT